MDSHHDLRRRFPAFELASRCSEVVDVLLPFRAPSADVYDILRAALKTLEVSTELKREWMVFVVRLLKCLGHGDFSSVLAEPSLERGVAMAEAELERVLPWKLKSTEI